MPKPKLALHPFWRITIVFIAATLIWLLVQGTVNALFGEAYNRQAHVLRAIGVFILAVPTVIAVRRLLDRQPSLRQLGLDPLPQAARHFIIGAAAWLIPAAAATVICLLMGWVELSTGAPLSAILFNTLSLAILVFIFEAFPEELIFRGYIFHTAAVWKSIGVAVVVQTLLFTAWGALNGGGITLDRTILFIVFGALFGVMRAVTGSVWTTIGFHLAFQTAAQLFSSVGGQFDTPSPILTGVAFGLVPAVFALPVLRRFYKFQPEWRSREKS